MRANLSLTPLQILRLLAWLRLGAVALQVAVLATVALLLSPDLPWAGLFAVPGGLLLANLLVWWRLRRLRAGTNGEVLLHLALDCLALTALLALSGGPANPFTSLYLLPIALAAAALPAAHAWATAVLCALLYAGLFWGHATGPVDHRFFMLHVWGMGANFLLGAVLLTAGLTALAGLLRRRERALSEARESILQHERIVATGLLAAGTAHELNTPLSTMAVLVSELRAREGLGTDVQDDLRLLEAQIDVCTTRLREMLSAADPGRHGQPEARPLRRYLEDSVRRWRLLRPEAEADLDFAPGFADPAVRPDPVLAQALGSLLDNAADASAANGSRRVAVTCRSDGKRLTVTIEDEGPGLDADQIARAGRGFFTTKPDGFGLGLVLSHATLARLGGEVRLLPRLPRGTRTEVEVPLAALTPGDAS